MPWGIIPESMALDGCQLLFAQHDADQQQALAEFACQSLGTATSPGPHHLFGFWDVTPQVCALVTDGQAGTFLVGDPGLAETTADNKVALSEQLAQQLAAWGKSQRVRMIQILLSDAAAAWWEPRFIEQGWERATRLYYLEARLNNLSASGPHPSLPANSVWQPATKLSQESLEHLLAQTHIDSRDCEFLAGKRSMRELLETYACSTQSGRELWEVLLVDGEPAACLLAGLQADDTQIEWVYVGVTAPFRRRGLGHVLVQQGFKQARERGIGSIVLGLDEANLPALRLYLSHGFRAWDRRVVLLQWWEPTVDLGITTPT